jgi:hypothetical protein
MLGNAKGQQESTAADDGESGLALRTLVTARSSLQQLWRYTAVQYSAETAPRQRLGNRGCCDALANMTRSGVRSLVGSMG